MTVIVFNNNIYGMTGGQYSPTTPQMEFGTTAPYGNIDRPFDIAELAAGAGASFAARGDAYHVLQTTKLIEMGIAHKGFSIIDCTTICPTYYGRKNKKGDAVAMMKFQRDHFVPDVTAKHMTAEQLEGQADRRRYRPERLPGADRSVCGAYYAGKTGGRHCRRKKGMSKQELRLAGSGGQGVILATIILAEAAVIAGKSTGAKPILRTGGARRLLQGGVHYFG